MGPPSFLAEWWPSGPRRQGFADAAQHAPLTAPCRSANPPLERKVGLGRQVKIYLTWTGILMDTHACQQLTSRTLLRLQDETRLLRYLHIKRSSQWPTPRKH